MKLPACASCRRPHGNAPLDKFTRAALLVEHALHGRRPVVPSTRAMAAQAIYHNWWYRNAYALVCVAFMMLAVWEPPAVATDSNGLVALRVFDYLCLCVTAGDLVLQYYYLGRRPWMRRGWVQLRLAATVAIFINLLAVSADPARSYPMRALRPLFLLERLRNVRRVFANIASTGPKVINVALLLVVHVLLFAVLGFVMYAGVDGVVCTPFRAEDPPACSTFENDPPCANYFGSLESSAMQLFQFLTAANFPEVMMPAYTCDRANVLYFVVFACIGVYLLLNLTLAVTYTTFKNLMAEEVLAKYTRIFAGCDLAFYELVPGAVGVSVGGATLPREARPPRGAAPQPCAVSIPASPSPSGIGLSKADFAVFFSRLRPDVEPEFTARVFDVFDHDGRGEVYRLEFRRLVLCFGKVKVQRINAGKSSGSAGKGMFASEAALRASVDATLARLSGALGAKGAPAATAAAPAATAVTSAAAPAEAAAVLSSLVAGRTVEADALAAVRTSLAAAGVSLESVVAEARASFSRASIAGRGGSDAASASSRGSVAPGASFSSAGTGGEGVDGAGEGSEDPISASGGGEDEEVDDVVAADLDIGVEVFEMPRPRLGSVVALPNPVAIAAAAVAADRGSVSTVSTAASSPTAGAGTTVRAMAVGNPLNAAASARTLAEGTVAVPNPLAASSSSAAPAGSAAASTVEEWGAGAAAPAPVPAARGVVPSLASSSTLTRAQCTAVLAWAEELESRGETDSAGAVAAAALRNAVADSRAGRLALKDAGAPARRSGSSSRGGARRPPATAPPRLEEEGGAASGGRLRRAAAALAASPGVRRVKAVLRSAAQRALAIRSTIDGRGVWASSRRAAALTTAKPGSWRARGAACMASFWCTLLFDAVVLINTVAVLVQLSLEHDDASKVSYYNPAINAMKVLQYVMLAFFMTEIALKVVLAGPAVYWKASLFNRADILLVLAAFLGTVLEVGEVLDKRISAGLSFLRFLRLIRILRVIPGFGLTVSAFADTLPVLGQYVTVLLSSFYFFSIIGMSLFANKLTADNAAVAKSSYGLVNYYTLNFDSLGGAFVCMFYLILLNDWPVLMEGTVAAIGRGAQGYFILFWAVNTVLVLNVIIAFVIESFGVQKLKRETVLQAALQRVGGGGAGGAQQSSSGIADWRALLLASGLDFSGWRLTRRTHHFDVYDELYKEEVKAAFPDTLG